MVVAGKLIFLGFLQGATTFALLYTACKKRKLLRFDRLHNSHPKFTPVYWGILVIPGLALNDFLSGKPQNKFFLACITWKVYASIFSSILFSGDQ